MSGSDFTQLPSNLPVPRDDGACDHLPGYRMPPIALPATDGTDISVAELSGRVVIFCYPLTGTPGVALPPGWDEIPGARGCTPETCGFRDAHAQLAGLGVRLFGLSTQSTAEQREVAVRLHLPFSLISDEQLKFAKALRLPAFAAGGRTLIKRLTLVVRDGSTEAVFYPVFPPDRHAQQVLEWVSDRIAVERS